MGLTKHSSGIFDDKEISGKASVDLFLRNKASIVWNAMKSFEGITVSLADTETLLKGYGIAGVSFDDQLKICSFGLAFDKLCQTIAQGEFYPDRCMLCEIHELVAKHELDAEDLGRFRTRDVSLSGVDGNPPSYKDLMRMWRKTNGHIHDTMMHPCERALSTFLSLCRTQYFAGANKLTAYLFANGMLVAEGYMYFEVSQEFMRILKDYMTNFHISGNADWIMEFFQAVY